MDGFNAWMEKNFVPIAAKIGSMKPLIGIRDGFINMMPVTMAGSVVTLLNVIVRDIPNGYFDGALSWIPTSGLGKFIIALNGNVWWGTLAVLGIVFAFSLGYALGRTYEVNAIATSLVSGAAVFSTIPQSYEGAGWGYFQWSYTNSNGLFTALIIGLIASFIFIGLTKKNIIIKLPEQVPPAVSRAFASIIPGLIAMYAVSVIVYICATWAGKPFNDLVAQYIQTPFMGLAQGWVAVFIVTFLVQLLWFFGLHGPNVLGPVLSLLWGNALNENMNAFNAGVAVSELPYKWTSGGFDAYSWMGGSGTTIGLLIAIWIFARKNPTLRAVATLSTPMGVFNINEPVTFGIPIVLNPVYFIPWVLISPILVMIGYFATAVGFVPPVYVSVPWVTPPIINAFMSTGGSITAALVSAFNLVLSIVLWAPFVILANRLDNKK